MNSSIVQLNLVLAWTWILFGFGSGMFLGLNFHRENWLGGYSSWKRRLYRLGHISFFGLAMVNLLFFFTARSCALGSIGVAIASWGFAVGALTMPVCCLVAAHHPRLRRLFAVPVISLIIGGFFTLWEIVTL